jgi:hypothetical protein
MNTNHAVSLDLVVLLHTEKYWFMCSLPRATYLVLFSCHMPKLSLRISLSHNYTITSAAPLHTGDDHFLRLRFLMQIIIMCISYGIKFGGAVLQNILWRLITYRKIDFVQPCYTLQNATSTNFTSKHTIFQKSGGKEIDPKIIFKSNIKNFINVLVDFGVLNLLGVTVYLKNKRVKNS